MKDIYVHLGAHKSASTTLQHNLRLNKELLREKGFLYISPAEMGPLPLGRHFRGISQKKFDADESLYLESISNAKSSLKDLINSDVSEKLKIIFSWEGFFGHSSLDKYQGIYTTNSLVGRSLAEIFGEYNTHFLMVTRRQDDFIESCYLQQIKEKRAIRFDGFVKNIDPARLSWLIILESIVANCGRDRVSAVPFELIKHVGAQGFVEECLRKLTGEENITQGFSWKEKANPSISGVGVEIALQTLPLLNNQDRKNEFIRFVFSSLSSAKHGKARYLDDFSKNLILEVCRNDNRALFDRYMSDYLRETNALYEHGQKVFQYYMNEL